MANLGWMRPFCCLVAFMGCSSSDGGGNSSASVEDWYLFGPTGINIRPAWDLSYGSPGVRVAVIDNRFLLESQAFSACKDRFDVLDFVGGVRASGYHGTEVTSLITSCADNPLGLVAINATSPFTLLERGQGRLGSNIDLVSWAAGDFDCSDHTYIDCPGRNAFPADVINASYGRLEEGGASGLSVIRSVYLNKIEQINRAGRILVAASGNESVSADINFPSSLTGVISAGASNEAGQVSDFSNWGETVEIIAPGEDVPVAGAGGVELVSGTSFSTPVVSGVVSLMKSVYPELNWKTATYFMQSTSVPLDCSEYCSGRSACERDCCIGAAQTQVCTPGRLDAGAAVNAARRAAAVGLPDVALVDSDEYTLRLELSGGIPFKMEGQFVLKNVGGKAGDYTLSWDVPEVTIFPTEVRLEASGMPGDKVTVYVESTEVTRPEARVKIADPNSRLTSGFSDELIVYIQ